MTTQPQNKNSNTHDKNSAELHDRFKQSLEPLFNPFIRVVPEKDWSSIKAIWIPFLHHDEKNKLVKSEAIQILQPSVDSFGTIQGYLTAPNENYIPYLTTFFNPALTQDQVIDKILQADQNILETQSIITDAANERIIRKTVIGMTKLGMMIAIVKNENDKIIDAFPVFDTESASTPNTTSRHNWDAKELS